jgi:hypothetical protein
MPFPILGVLTRGLSNLHDIFPCTTSYVVRGVIILYANSTSPMYGVFILPCLSCHGYTGHTLFFSDRALRPITNIRPKVGPGELLLLYNYPDMFMGRMNMFQYCVLNYSHVFYSNFSTLLLVLQL